MLIFSINLLDTVFCILQNSPTRLFSDPSSSNFPGTVSPPRISRFPNGTQIQLPNQKKFLWSYVFFTTKSAAIHEAFGVAAHCNDIMSSDMLKSFSFPVPTLDRPFGVHLWPLFDQFYTSVVGYAPTDFRFVPGQTAISTLQATVALLSTYYITVFTGRELMKNRAPLNLNSLFMVHNLYLTIISGTLLALFIEQLVPTVWRNGIFFAICDHRGGWTEPLVALYYVSSCSREFKFLPKLIICSSIISPNTLS